MDRLIPAVLVILVSFTACTPKHPHIDSFETVWETIHEDHYDPIFGGVDWEESRRRFQPLIAGATSISEFNDIVNEMLFEMNLSHQLVIDPKDLEKSLPVLFAPGSIGIQVRILNGRVVVSSVEKDSPADQQGIKIGYTIIKIGNTSTEKLIKNPSMIPPFNSRHKQNRAANDVMALIYGAPNTDVKLTYLDYRANRIEKTFIRKGLEPTASEFSALPPYYLNIKSKVIDGSIGYIWISQFDDSLESDLENILKSMADTKGIVIDLRGNSGGFFSAVDWLAEQLITEKTVFYQMKFRNRTVNNRISPTKNGYKGQVVVLIDALSTSASEAFAAGIQEIGRGAVIGDRSPGFILGCKWKELSNGAVFMHTVAQILSPNGKLLEGHGVIPDVEIALDAIQLKKGEDSQLNEAVKYINAQVLHLEN